MQPTSAEPRDQVTYPRHTPGLGRLVDRSCFRGTRDQLAAWWAIAGIPT